MTDTAVDELLSVCACDLGVELLTHTGTYYIRRPSIHALIEYGVDDDGIYLIDLDFGTRSLRLLVNPDVIKYPLLSEIFGLQDLDSCKAGIGNADEEYVKSCHRYQLF